MSGVEIQYIDVVLICEIPTPLNASIYNTSAALYQIILIVFRGLWKNLSRLKRKNPSKPKEKKTNTK